jgi:hypothetical protein
MAFCWRRTYFGLLIILDEKKKNGKEERGTKCVIVVEDEF